MRKLQNLRQPTIKGNEWQRTNVERQILVKKQQRHQNGQIRKRPNHSLLKLPQTHRLHLFTVCKRRCNAISAEQLPQKPVKQQANFTTRKNCTKPAPLAITTPHAPLPHLHRLHKTQFNTISTETITTKPVKQQANFTTSKQSCTKPAPLAITTRIHRFHLFTTCKRHNAMHKVQKQLPQKSVKQQSHSRHSKKFQTKKARIPCLLV